MFLTRKFEILCCDFFPVKSEIKVEREALGKGKKSELMKILFVDVFDFFSNKKGENIVRLLIAFDRSFNEKKLQENSIFEYFKLSGSPKQMLIPVLFALRF